MPIRVHNTLTRQLEDLAPLRAGHVGLYVCGPTVYDDCHIGHLMGPVLFDTIARWLRARGLQVRFVNNITDIDDKIIDRSMRTGEDWKEITVRYTEQYLGFLRQLHVTTVTDHPRCTDFIPPMVTFTQALVEHDRAYPAADGVYYDVQQQQGYGKLSGRRLADMLAGTRGEPTPGLRHPADFALWKLAKPGEPSWPSPFGAGRPGWHVECSVMASELLGTEFDIHGGGDDLKFPHHENEIAQSEACGHRYAHVWMHHGLVQYGGKKVAKSDPRMQDPTFSQQFQARWLIDTYGAPTLRFFLLRGHYRRPIDFEPANLDAARKGLQRLFELLGEAATEPTADDVLTRELPAPAAAARTAFAAAMDEDFNSGEAVAALFTLAAHARKAEGSERAASIGAIRDLGRLLGLFQPADGEVVLAAATPTSALTEGAIRLLLDLRQEARARKDFALSDRVRDGLLALGVAIKDGKDGATWEMVR